MQNICSSNFKVFHVNKLSNSNRSSKFRFNLKRSYRVRCKVHNENKKQQSSRPDKDAGLGLKTAWFVSVQIGNLSSLLNKQSQNIAEQTQQESKPIENIDQVIKLIRADYAENYFISGKGEMTAYEADCLFSDPFTSFRGVERFKKNVGNFGDFMEDESVKLDILDFVVGENSVTAKWRFKCVLKFPWRPILAAGGNTKHILDSQSFKVVEHLESWDTEPGRVLKLLLKPSSKIPRNQWEVFFLALYDKDVKGMWFAITPSFVRIGALVLTVSWLVALVQNEEMQGWGYGFLLTGVLAGLVTEVVKFAQGMQGGETGTGGRF